MRFVAFLSRYDSQQFDGSLWADSNESILVGANSDYLGRAR
jgi:hypothetical protein